MFNRLKKLFKRKKPNWKPLDNKSTLEILNAKKLGSAKGGSTYTVNKWQAKVKETKAPFTGLLWVRETNEEEAARIGRAFKDLKKGGLSVPNLVSIEKNKDSTNSVKTHRVIVSDVAKPEKVLDLAMPRDLENTPEFQNMSKKDAERLGEYLAKFHNADYLTDLIHHNTRSGHLYVIKKGNELYPKAVDVENAIKTDDLENKDIKSHLYESYLNLNFELQAPFRKRLETASESLGAGFARHQKIQKEIEKEMKITFLERLHDDAINKKFDKAFDKAVAKDRKKRGIKIEKPKPIVTNRNRKKWLKALRLVEVGFMEAAIIPNARVDTFMKSYFKHSNRDTEKEFGKILNNSEEE